MTTIATFIDLHIPLGTSRLPCLELEQVHTGVSASPHQSQVNYKVVSTQPCYRERRCNVFTNCNVSIEDWI